MRVGHGYGVYAGLNVQRETWESSAQVRAQRKPAGLMSGCWTGQG